MQWPFQGPLPSTNVPVFILPPTPQPDSDRHFFSFHVSLVSTFHALQLPAQLSDLRMAKSNGDPEEFDALLGSAVSRRLTWVRLAPAWLPTHAHLPPLAASSPPPPPLLHLLLQGTQCTSQNCPPATPDPSPQGGGKEAPRISLLIRGAMNYSPLLAQALQPTSPSPVRPLPPTCPELCPEGRTPHHHHHQRTCWLGPGPV